MQDQPYYRLLAAIVAGLVAFTLCAEMAAAMPFAGSAYSWVNVLFGEFFGWVAGWALLAEYFIAVAFVASGFSANLRGLVKPIGINYLQHYQIHLVRMAVLSILLLLSLFY